MNDLFNSAEKPDRNKSGKYADLQKVLNLADTHFFQLNCNAHLYITLMHSTLPSLLILQKKRSTHI